MGQYRVEFSRHGTVVQTADGHARDAHRVYLRKSIGTASDSANNFVHVSGLSGCAFEHPLVEVSSYARKPGSTSDNFD
jgi:hypothetical protein